MLFYTPKTPFQEKRSPTDEFGFNLQFELNKGHYIGAVDKGGLADKAGLETGLRIVGVNGEVIFSTTRHRVCPFSTVLGLGKALSQR